MAGRDPHGESMFWLMVIGAGSLAVIALAIIGLWTVFGWLL